MTGRSAWATGVSASTPPAAVQRQLPPQSAALVRGGVVHGRFAGETADRLVVADIVRVGLHGSVGGGQALGRLEQQRAAVYGQRSRTALRDQHLEAAFDVLEPLAHRDVLQVVR